MVANKQLYTKWNEVEVGNYRPSYELQNWEKNQYRI